MPVAVLADFVTYLFHYFIARTLYSSLGSGSGPLLLVVAIIAGVTAFRWSRKRSRS